MTQTATTITVDSLPVANSIDPVQDRLLIYTSAATDIQGISRNVLLCLSSQTVGINDSQTLTTKVLDNTNSLTIKAANLVIQDGTDTAKQAKFIASGITTGNTRNYTLPDYNATLATLAGTETLTNKTLTAPVTTAIANTGGLSTNAVTVTAGATVGTTLAVTGNTTVGGTLGITGATTLTGAIGGAGYSLTTMANPYKFRASRNAVANTGNNAFAVVAFDTKQYDTTTNQVAGVFTAPIAGFYHFSWNVGISQSGTALTTVAALFVNGTRTSDGDQKVTTNVTISSNGSDTVQLSAGDTVDIRAFCTTTQALNVGSINATYWSGCLESAT